MGDNSFAPFLKYHTAFIVRNVTPIDNKVIRIFNYPIMYQETRDLLQIPGVAESDIRASLLKGEILHKFLAKDIAIVFSNIDLLQFSDKQRAWLYSLGFNEGVQVGYDELDGYVQSIINQGGGGTIPYLLKQRIMLNGPIDGINRTFTVPTPDKFLDGSYFGNIFHIYITHNGNALKLGTNFTISESGGSGTGYDTINLISFTPLPGRSSLEASYVILA